MNEQNAKELREPFPAELVGKLPRIWCGACRDARTRVCDEHRKAKCGECGNSITSAHLHLDYVGHADVTDRLLRVDPSWTWEPLAFDQAGLPAVDSNGGLWIRLAVAGVTRLGYGHADGKRGGDAVKEAIGDAIRNAALRFGVAIDLWRKEPPSPDAASGPERPVATRPARPRRAAVGTQDEAQPSGPDDTAAGAPSRPAMAKMFALLGQRGLKDKAPCLDYIAGKIGRPIESRSELTGREVRLIIRALEQELEAAP